MMVSHVDDLLWTGEPAMQEAMEAIQGELRFGSLDEGDFGYCGRQIRQDKQGIKVTCPSTAAKVRPIFLTATRKKQRDAKATDLEIGQLRSVLGSLNWVARVCRPDISYQLSSLQAIQKEACVEDLVSANKLLRYVQDSPEVGVFYKFGGVNLDEAVLLSITDASYAADFDVSKSGKAMGNRSQSGRLLCLADKDFVKNGSGHVYLLQHHSNVLRRVCRSTLQAETLSMVAGLEEAEHMRTVMFGMLHSLDKGWRTAAMDFIDVHMYTDCRSLEAHLLQAGLGSTNDKRLAIDMSALRQMVWRKRGEEYGDPLGDDKIDDNCTTRVEWIETSSMPADSLTKRMRDDQLLNMMATSELRVDRDRASKKARALK